MSHHTLHDQANLNALSKINNKMPKENDELHCQDLLINTDHSSITVREPGGNTASAHRGAGLNFMGLT